MTTVLALDTATPDRASLCLARAGEILFAETFPQRRSSAVLVPLLEEALDASGGALDDLDGIVAVRGPGSFTGLRVGLATVLGLHQAAGVSATAVTTFDALLAARRRRPGERILSTSPAIRGEWYVRIDDDSGLSEPRRIPGSELASLEPDVAVTTAPRELVELLSEQPEVVGVDGLALPLAAASSLEPPSWATGFLIRPLYLAPPPARSPGDPKRVSAP